MSQEQHHDHTGALSFQLCIQAAKCTQQRLSLEISGAHKCLLASCTQVEAFGNMIGPEGGHAFAKALETNTCIQELTLGSRNKPASIPLKSLRENSVNTLDYSGKELLPEGGIVLAFMLRSNTSVTKVSGRF